MYLGMASLELAVVYVLCILAAVWCVVYGLFFWNIGGKPDNTQEMVDWEKEEREIEKEMP
jgi:hypothetical protein